MSAQQLNDTKVVMGKLIKVANQEKKINENEVYVSIQVEDEDGNNERCLLFTEVELSDMEKITFDFALNKMKDGRLYKAKIDNKDTYLMKINNDGNEMILRISNSQLKIAESRSARNLEDLTEKSWITDLTD